MMSLSKNRIVRAPFVSLSDKKFRVALPDGWADTSAEEEEARKLAEVNRLSEEAMQHELEKFKILKDQILSEAEKESQRIESRTRVEADKIVRDAIIKADAERKKIHDEAYKAGFEEGIAAGRDEGEGLKAAAAKTLDEAKQTRQEMINNLEPEIVDLTVSVAEKLIRRKAAYEPSLVLALLRAGLEESASAGSFDEISVMVSEDDYPTVSEKQEELLKIVGGGAKLDIVRDPSLTKADCVIKTPFGYIDTSLTQGFEKLRENLYLIGAGEEI